MRYYYADSRMQHLGLKKIDIEVLPWNQIGYSFWKNCGFKEMEQ